VENKYHLVEKGCNEKRPKMMQETTEGLWDLQLLGWKQQGKSRVKLFLASVE